MKNAKVSRDTMRFGGIGVMLLVVLALHGSVFGSTDKASWILNASNQILTNYPQIDAFMWFNQYKPWMGEPDWRVDTDPAARAAYQASWGGLQQGVYLQGFPPDITELDTFEALVGASQDRVGWYESLSSPFPTSYVQTVQARGTTPYIVFEPFDASLGDTARSGQSRLQSIVDGDYDIVLTQWAQAAAANGQSIEICFGQEMNGNWFTWGYLNDDYTTPADEFSAGHMGNTADLYKRAFRHVVEVFEAQGANNVDFVWSINASYTDDFSMAFPDTATKEYVDRMGMNGFNWGERLRDPSNPQWDDWREFEQIFGQWWPGSADNYDILTGLSDAPIIIGEFATVPEPVSLALLGMGGLALLRRRRHG